MVSLLGILQCVPWSSSTYRQVASSILTLHLINPVHGSIVLQCWTHVAVGPWQAVARGTEKCLSTVSEGAAGNRGTSEE